MPIQFVCLGVFRQKLCQNLAGHQVQLGAGLFRRGLIRHQIGGRVDGLADDFRAFSNSVAHGFGPLPDGIGRVFRTFLDFIQNALGEGRSTDQQGGSKKQYPGHKAIPYVTNELVDTLTQASKK